MKIKFTLIASFIALGMNAQTPPPGTVTGKVVDQKTKEVIPYATITVKQNTEIVTGDTTDDNGKFTIENVPLQEVLVEVEYIGFKTYSSTIRLRSDTKKIDLGTIELTEDSEMLEGIVINAERSTMEQLVDRKVIHVGKDLSTAGASASDIMNNIPSVNVDQDGNISMRGNDNVKILIDGKPSNLDPKQLLKQLPSNSIDKIELITNPSAKYNPEGMSGMINIVLKKNMNDGFNGMYTGGITFAKEPKYNQTLDMNLRKGKFNFFGNYGYMQSTTFNDGEITQKQDLSQQLFHIMNDVEGHNFKAGFDFYINPKNTFSAYTYQNYADGYGIVDNHIVYPTRNTLQQKDRYNSNHKNQIYNAAFKHVFSKPEHTLDVEVNYTQNKANQDASFNMEGNTITPYQDRLRDKEQSVIANIDYANPLSEKSKLELGAEYRSTKTDNTYGTTSTNLKDANFDYNVDIFSAYATFGQKYEKWSYQLGARLEKYNVEANYYVGSEYAPFKDDYLTVYPSAFLSYTPNQSNFFQLSASRRVDRPSVGQTKPIREYSTPRVVSVGNPELRPQFTNSVEFNYTRILGVKGSITAGVYYRAIEDVIQRTFAPDTSSEAAIADNRMIMSYGNFDNSNAYGAEISANYKITKWWDIQPSAEYYHLKQQGIVTLFNETTNQFDTFSREVGSYAFNARLNNNFKITNNFRATLFGFYRGPFDAINATTKEMYKIDAGVRYTFWENKGSLSLRFNDIFNTMKYAYESDTPYRSEGQFTWESQSLYVGFTYAFGAGKNRAMQRKQREVNETQKSGGFF